MLKILVLILLLPLNTFADDISEVIKNDEANRPAVAADPTPPVALSGKAGGHTAGMVRCLDAINKASPVQTREYVQSGGAHMIFKDGVNASEAKGRGFIYAGEKGIFYCNMNWPKPEGKAAKNFKFKLDGKEMQPFGPSENNIGDVTKDCVKSSGENLEMYVQNQVAANLRTYGKTQRSKNTPRNKALASIKSGCKSFDKAENYFGEGFSSADVQSNGETTGSAGTVEN